MVSVGAAGNPFVSARGAGRRRYAGAAVRLGVVALLTCGCAKNAGVRADFVPSAQRGMAFGRFIQTGCEPYASGVGRGLDHSLFHFGASLPDSTLAPGDYMAKADLADDHFAVGVAPGRYGLVELSLRNGPTGMRTYQAANGWSPATPYVVTFEVFPDEASYVGTIEIACIETERGVVVDVRLASDFARAQQVFAARFTSAGALVDRSTASRLDPR